MHAPPVTPQGLQKHHRAKARKKAPAHSSKMNLLDLEHIIEDCRQALKDAAHLSADPGATNDEEDPHIFSSEDESISSKDPSGNSETPPPVTP
ncbi:hypothetical protein NDU88_002824 [Pleurodeles waltl]|uniref:Uncharacterized protein n=1 Tax=Pleurodeles waltl TaxID=8319 RepID=A0AAV7KVT7_PLEWA|nr:hypothetical protein NDU88_002824 [Pleurodeles waltl]